MVDHPLSIQMLAGRCHLGWRGKHPAPLTAYVTLTSQYSHFISSEWEKTILLC